MDTVPTSGGVHTSRDMDGRLRIGAELFKVEGVDYKIDNQRKQAFYDSARTIMPFIEWDDMEPEMAAIHPLPFGAGPMADYIIHEESDRGLPGLINLLAINPPGLTCSPAIAEYVGDMVTKMLGK